MARTGILMPLLAAWLLLPALGWADMYVYYDEKGTPTATNRTPERRDEIRKLEEASARNVLYRSRDITSPFMDLIKAKALKYGLDPMFVSAVIAVESGFDPRAVSRKGAMGLMQIMPSTALELGLGDPFSPSDNIDAGCRYLSMMDSAFEGDMSLVLAAYNAGPAAVKKYGKVPPFKETTDYVRKVLSLYQTPGRRVITPRATSNPDRSPAEIYTVVLEDGSILYTNSKSYLTGRSAR